MYPSCSKGRAAACSACLQSAAATSSRTKFLSSEGLMHMFVQVVLSRGGKSSCKERSMSCRVVVGAERPKQPKTETAEILYTHQKRMKLMPSTRIVIRTGVGLHARPAAELVREAKKHACSVTLEYQGRTADAKSILQVLALGVKDGAEVTVRTEGEGDESAVASIERLLSSGFESA